MTICVTASFWGDYWATWRSFLLFPCYKTLWRLPTFCVQ